MADLKISEMTSASQINNDDNVELSQGNSQSGFASVKASILAIAQKIITGINFTSALETESKTIAGAINEVAQGGGGSSTFAGLSDVDIDDTTLANGQVPKWNSTTEKWENGNAGGGSGGHTILDDSGTSLAQEDDLQFKGTYSEDDSTNGKTVVNITREMPQAQYDLLSANEKKGIIRITDDDYVCEDSEVKHSAGVSVKDELDGITIDVDAVMASGNPRATNIVNKSKKFGKQVVINVTFESAITASNSPGMVYMKSNPPTIPSAFSCVKLDSNGDIEAVVGAYYALTNNSIYIKEVTNGSKYVLTGCYALD